MIFLFTMMNTGREMGVFSWRTCDTQESINGEEEFIYLLMPDGQNMQFCSYDGYGSFDGLDMYNMLAYMNGVGNKYDLEANCEKQRERGIYMEDDPDLSFYLKFSTNLDTNYEDWPPSEICPHQGHFEKKDLIRKEKIFDINSSFYEVYDRVMRKAKSMDQMRICSLTLKAFETGDLDNEIFEDFFEDQAREHRVGGGEIFEQKVDMFKRLFFKPRRHKRVKQGAAHCFVEYFDYGSGERYAALVIDKVV